MPTRRANKITIYWWWAFPVLFSFFTHIFGLAFVRWLGLLPYLYDTLNGS